MNKITLNNATIDIDELTAEQIMADCGDEIRTVLVRGWV